jgi:TetR/AcrR family transcriptional regulator
LTTLVNSITIALTDVVNRAAISYAKETSTMISKFLSLETEKRERMLNAAMKEFAEKGFAHASTNEIVKEANISKGLLFHYFRNKKDLFLFLYDYVLEMLMNELVEKMDVTEKDLVNRLRQWAQLKMDLIKKHPDMFQFILAAQREEAPEVKHELERKNKDIIAKGYAVLFEDIDTSRFKEGIDIQRAIQMMIWTLEGFSAQEQQKVKSLSLRPDYYDEVLAETEKYLDLFTTCFYR